MEFLRQGYWSGLPFSSPGDLPDSGIESESPALWADSLTSEPPGKPKKKVSRRYILLTLSTLLFMQEMLNLKKVVATCTESA